MDISPGSNLNKFIIWQCNMSDFMTLLVISIKMDLRGYPWYFVLLPLFFKPLVTPLIDCLGHILIAVSKSVSFVALIVVALMFAIVRVFLPLIVIYTL